MAPWTMVVGSTRSLPYAEWFQPTGGLPATTKLNTHTHTHKKSPPKRVTSELPLVRCSGRDRFMADRWPSVTIVAALIVALSFAYFLSCSLEVSFPCPSPPEGLFLCTRANERCYLKVIKFYFFLHFDYALHIRPPAARTRGVIYSHAEESPSYTPCHFRHRPLATELPDKLRHDWSAPVCQWRLLRCGVLLKV